MIADTIDRIRAHLKLRHVTKKGLAEQAGLHPNTLQGVEDAGWNPSVATLRALEAQVLSHDSVIADSTENFADRAAAA